MRHVLLGGGLQRILQRLVEDDALLGVDGQLVDERRLRGDLVVERIDEGLEHRGVAFQRLALGQKLLLLGLLLVVFGRHLGTLAFQLRAFGLAGRRGDLVLDVEQQRVEFLDALLRGRQGLDGRLAAFDHLAEAGLGRLVALVENVLLRLQDADDGVGLGKQFLEIAGEAHVAHAVGAQALLALFGKDAHELFPARVVLHRFEFGAEHVGGVLQPDDEVGDVRLHRLLLGQHVLDAGVLDVEIGIADRLVGVGERVEHGAGLLDLRAHVLDDLFGPGNLGIEILQRRHGTPPFECHPRAARDREYREAIR